MLYYNFGQSILQGKFDLTGILNLDVQTGSNYESDFFLLNTDPDPQPCLKLKPQHICSDREYLLDPAKKKRAGTLWTALDCQL